MIWGLLAFAVAAAFSGAAVYINLVEHPARRELAPAAALTQWKAAYRRGFAMQATLAVVGGMLGLVWYATGAGWPALAGALVLLANWPFTLAAIMPVNRRLTATEPAVADGETRVLLDRWARLHAVRSGLGLTATVLLGLGLVTAAP